MRVRVDRQLCQGHGQCNMACPEVFGFDEQGFAVVQSEEVPAALEQAVRAAELRCPERAIEIRGAER